MQAKDLMHAWLHFFKARTLSAQLLDNADRKIIDGHIQVASVQIKKNTRIELATDGCNTLELEIPLKR
jgi:hypothetical protein